MQESYSMKTAQTKNAREVLCGRRAAVEIGVGRKQRPNKNGFGTLEAYEFLSNQISDKDDRCEIDLEPTGRFLRLKIIGDFDMSQFDGIGNDTSMRIEGDRLDPHRSEKKQDAESIHILRSYWT
jgi:hypothetical protein